MQNVAGGRLPLRTRATCSAAATTSPTSTVAAVLQFQSRSGAVQRRLSRPGHLGCRRPRRRARRKRPRSTPLRRHREDDASGRSRPRRAPQVIRRKWRLHYMCTRVLKTSRAAAPKSSRDRRRDWGCLILTTNAIDTARRRRPRPFPMRRGGRRAPLRIRPAESSALGRLTARKIL